MANIVTYSKLWEPTLITAAEATIYTASTASSTGVVKNISATITNTSTSGVTVELWVVPASGSTSNTNKRIPGEVVPAESRLSFTVGDMKSNDFIVVKAATASVLNIQSDSGIAIN